MKRVIFSDHALEQMKERGAVKEEVIETVSQGERIQVKKGRIGFRRNFQFSKDWAGRYYAIKQVFAIAAHENDHYIVVTVYVFYF